MIGCLADRNTLWVVPIFIYRPALLTKTGLHSYFANAQKLVLNQVTAFTCIILTTRLFKIYN